MKEQCAVELFKLCSKYSVSQVSLVLDVYNILNSESKKEVELFDRLVKGDIKLVTIESIKSLDAKTKKKLELHAKDLFGTDLLFDYVLNPLILGGFKLTCGDKVFDATLFKFFGEYGMNVKVVGKVLSVKDGIIYVSGLSNCGFNDFVLINGKEKGIVLNLDPDIVSIAVIGEWNSIKEGDTVESLGEGLSIKVDETILGKTVNSLGINLDIGKDTIACPNGTKMPLEKVAPNIMDRKNVDRALLTGTIGIDAVIPVGKGQRELIIGDRQTGKTALCIDAILNQKDKNVKCVYVSIGQKNQKTALIRAKLAEAGAMEYTTIVSAGASDSAAMIYTSPYAGCAIAEYFAQKGQDVLISYDDLTKHAWAYRELSLLLRRPAGREAYPGDIFYAHSRLLERALQYSDKLGGGSITALPVIETSAGDITAYVPTNVISITDGQVFLDIDLFNSGQKPAIDVGSSVSRVGSSAQIPLMKQYASKLKLELAQFREMAAFSQFGSEIDAETKTKLERGAIITSILKQSQYKPYKVEDQITLIFAAINGLLDKIHESNLSNFIPYLLTNTPETKKIFLALIAEHKKTSDAQTTEIKKEIETCVTNFLKRQAK